MTYRALIPVKALNEVKSRLAPHLTQQQRVTLVLDMLHHVIDVLHASEEIEMVAVVSPDHKVLEKVQEWGARALIEEQSGHNPALHAAAQRLAKGATALLTISADLPLLEVRDIQSMVEQAQEYDIVLAPSYEETGTNALLVRPPLAIPYVFGPNSLLRYRREAKRWHLSNIIYHSMGTATDIDTIDNLETVRRYQLERREVSASI